MTAVEAFLFMPAVFAILLELGWSGLFLGEAVALAGWLAWKEFGVI